jgi:hypothetical protein
MLTYALAAALAAVVGVIAGKRIFKRDDQWERTAEHLLELSAALQDYGLKDIPRGLRLAAIKDVSGVLKLVRFYIELMKRDPDAVRGEFDKVFERVAEARANNATKKASDAKAPVTQS